MLEPGKITREIQESFGIPPGTSRVGASGELENRITLDNLRALLASLDRITEQLVERRRVVSLTDAGDVAFDANLLAWRGRLGAYHDALDAATDRKQVIWTVTAPLLLGFYGGEASTLGQSTLDAATPFVLSNSLDVGEAWREERWNLFLSDLKENAKDLAIAGGNTLLLLALGVGGYLLLTRK